MTVVAYSCNAVINVAANQLSNVQTERKVHSTQLMNHRDDTTCVTERVAGVYDTQSKESPPEKHATNHTSSSIRNTNNIPEMTKSPLGSQNDICSDLEPVKKTHLDTGNTNSSNFFSKKISKNSNSENVNSGTTSGGFFKRPLKNVDREPSPSKKNGKNADKEKSPSKIAEDDKHNSRSKNGKNVSPDVKRPKGGQKSPKTTKKSPNPEHKIVKTTQNYTESEKQQLHMFDQIEPSNGSSSSQKSTKPSSTSPSRKSSQTIEHKHNPFSSPFKISRFTYKNSDNQSNQSSGSKSDQKPDTNLISTATSALKRLHFKSGRNATKTSSRVVTNFGQNGQQTVPKVIVMGSSSTSENTINTSTDSANTIITTMTNTDEYLTEDSLDKHDSVDMLLNDHQLIDITNSSTSIHSSNSNLSDGKQCSMCQGQNPCTVCEIRNTNICKRPEEIAENRCIHCNELYIRQCLNPTCDKSEQYDTSETIFLFQHSEDGNSSGPKTAFHDQKFLFDSPTIARATAQPKSPKYATKGPDSKFTFDEIDAPSKRSKQTKSVFNFDFKTPHSGTEEKPRSYQRRRQSEHIQATFYSDEKLNAKSKSHHNRSHSRRRRQSSPRNEFKKEQKPAKSSDDHTFDPSKSKSHYKSKKSVLNHKEERKRSDDSPSKVRTPPLPDLRVDFFSGSMDASQEMTCHTVDSGENASSMYRMSSETEKRGSVCLNQCLREVGASLECALTPCGSLAHNINVTTNPLDSSTVHQRSINVTRNVPQATIVVQQPSLSLDSGTANISTVLLKNGTEFVSNVSVPHYATTKGDNGKISKRQQREENMKHLLDVANTLTLEELHDFEMRYGSPHHSRSQSVKTPGRSSGGRPNYLCLPQQRSRVASMPNTGVEEEYYRLRHFSITGKGVVNRGDSLKSRRSRSNNSVASSNSSTEHLTMQGGPASYPGSARTSVSSRESSNTSQTGGLLLLPAGPSTAVQAYRVAMLGAAGVGKSSLVSQFMTSEYLHAYDTSIDDDSGEKSVSVLLAGEESELTFIDLPYADISPENVTGTYRAGDEPHAYCVVFSCADRGSLAVAERALAALWTSGSVASKAVILVANKADLVRSRVVTTDEGKTIATQYDCKFIETSVSINHNVDELLVGVLTQIRLKLENPEKTRDLFRKRSYTRKNRNKSPNRMGNSITSALTSCGGGANNNGDSDGVTSTGYCWAYRDGSQQNSPKKYRGSRTSASLKVKGLLGKVWARDSKSKSCENLHVL